jgi:outer membrane protein assembly factor BamB
MYGGDATRGNFALQSGVTTPPVTWIPGRLPAIALPGMGVAANGDLVVASYYGVQRMTPAGVSVWFAEYPTSTRNDLALGSSAVFLSTGPAVYAFNATTGGPLWSAAPPDGSAVTSMLLLGAAGVVLVGSATGALLFVDAGTGAVVNATQLVPGGQVTSMAASATTLVVTTAPDAQIRSYALPSLAPLWSASCLVGGGATACNAVPTVHAASGMVLLGVPAPASFSYTTSFTVSAWTADGRLAWLVNASTSVWTPVSPPAVTPAADSLVYFQAKTTGSTGQLGVLSVRLATGAVVWFAPLQQWGQYLFVPSVAPLVDGRGNVFVLLPGNPPTQPFGVAAFNATGGALWGKATDFNLVSPYTSLALGLGGQVIASGSGLAIVAATPLPSPSPTPSATPSRTPWPNATQSSGGGGGGGGGGNGLPGAAPSVPWSATTQGVVVGVGSVVGMGLLMGLLEWRRRRMAVAHHAASGGGVEVGVAIPDWHGGGGTRNPLTAAHPREAGAPTPVVPLAPQPSAPWAEEAARGGGGGAWDRGGEWAPVMVPGAHTPTPPTAPVRALRL